MIFPLIVIETNVAVVNCDTRFGRSRIVIGMPIVLFSIDEDCATSKQIFIAGSISAVIVTTRNVIEVLDIVGCVMDLLLMMMVRHSCHCGSSRRRSRSVAVGGGDAIAMNVKIIADRRVYRPGHFEFLPRRCPAHR